MRTALAQLILHIAGVHLDANGVPREIPTEAAPDVGLLGTRTALIAHLFPVVDEGVRDEYGGWGRSGSTPPRGSGRSGRSGEDVPDLPADGVYDVLSRPPYNALPVWAAEAVIGGLEAQAPICLPAVIGGAWAAAEAGLLEAVHRDGFDEAFYTEQIREGDVLLSGSYPTGGVLYPTSRAPDTLGDYMRWAASPQVSRMWATEIRALGQFAADRGLTSAAAHAGSSGGLSNAALSEIARRAAVVAGGADFTRGAVLLGVSPLDLLRWLSLAWRPDAQDVAEGATEYSEYPMLRGGAAAVAQSYEYATLAAYACVLAVLDEFPQSEAPPAGDTPAEPPATGNQKPGAGTDGGHTRNPDSETGSRSPLGLSTPLLIAAALAGGAILARR